jgi:HEAT repeat protein
MTRFIPKIFLDFPSFWVGVFLAAFIIFLFFRYRSKLTNLFSKSTKQVRSFRDNLSVTSTTEYNQILYKYVQEKHLISDISPLERVLVPPKCVAPSPSAIPGEETIDPSLLQQTLGYDPAYPEFHSEYNAPTFTLLEALTKGVSICLLGFPGTGKTVAFADSITTLVTGESTYPVLADKVAFIVEAQHILQQFPGSDILLILLTAIQANPVFSKIPNFPKFLTTTINSNDAIIFIDGLDLLSQIDTNRVANYIIALCNKMPSLQIVAAASPSYLGNLNKAPLEPVSIAPWNQEDKSIFLKKLSDPHGKLPALFSIDDLNYTSDFIEIRNSLLISSGRNLTPLEFTLLTLAAYSKDLTGSSAIDAINTYLNRILRSLSENTIRTLENIALHVLDQEKSSFTKRDVNSWLSNLDKSSPELSDDKTSPLNRGIQIALNSNLLQKTGPDGYFFTYPTIAGFLAARGLRRSNDEVIQRILNQPDWSLVHETMRFFSAFNPVTPYLDQLVSDPSLLKVRLLRACSWLPYLKNDSTEEQNLLRSVTKEIYTNPIYLVKLRLTLALARSGNPNTGTIFRHLLKTNNPDTKRAAAFGAGYIYDLTSVSLLIKQMSDPFPASVSACYALGKIASPKALEAIADGLLHGSELLRRAAAESLAQNRSEGHPALREGIARDDLLVRYAVVHGLSLINETWAIDFLDKLRIDENEWVVRDLAQHAFEIFETGSPYLPTSQPPVHKSAWLRIFSDQHNLTAVSPKTALDLLLTALEKGTDEQKQAALSYLRRLFIPDHIPSLLKLLDDPNPVIIQQAALVLWFCLPPGYKISPSPE